MGTPGGPREQRCEHYIKLGATEDRDRLHPARQQQSWDQLEQKWSRIASHPQRGRGGRNRVKPASQLGKREASGERSALEKRGGAGDAKVPGSAPAIPIACHIHSVFNHPPRQQDQPVWGSGDRATTGDLGEAVLTGL